MSRRTVLWKRKIKQAGGEVEKVLPTRNVKGKGTYLANTPGTERSKQGRIYHEGGQVSLPMDPVKAQRVRALAKGK